MCKTLCTGFFEKRFLRNALVVPVSELVLFSAKRFLRCAVPVPVPVPVPKPELVLFSANVFCEALCCVLFVTVAVVQVIPLSPSLLL